MIVPQLQKGAAALPDYTTRELRDFGARIRAHRNESAFRLPAPVERALSGITWDDLRRYPADRYEELCDLLAVRLCVPLESVVVSNGSDDLILALATAFAGPGTSVITARPTFGMYARAAVLREAELRPVPYLRRWQLDADSLIGACDPGTRLIFLGNPNNPTGDSLERRTLERILAQVPQAVVVVDEAYLSRSGTSYFSDVSGYENLCVISTLSKVPGLAGLRCGFGAAPPEVARALRRVMQPHPLTVPALLAMYAYFQDVFDDPQYHARYQAFVDASLGRIAAELGPLAASVSRGDTNFALFEFGDRAAAVAESLERSGIFVRRIESPDFDGAIRINALNPAETADLIAIATRALAPSYA